MQDSKNQDGSSIWDNAIDLVGGVCSSVYNWIGDLFRQKHYCLLTGFSRAGKTEAYLALKDIAELDKHPNHSDRVTLGNHSYPPIRLAGKLFALSDGGGHECREKQYEEYFKTAEKHRTISTIVYFFDLDRADSFLHSSTEKARLQKEFAQLNRLASGHAKNADGQFRMIVVGSHKDCFIFERNLQKAANEMRVNLSQWVDKNLFCIKGFIEADLKSDDGARAFTKELLTLLDKSE